MENMAFSYNGFSCEMDIGDYIVKERVEDALELFKESAEKATQCERESQQFKGLIEAIAVLFDVAFGDENAANKILGGTTNIISATDALVAFVDFCREQNMTISSHIVALGSKYMPNRKARRAKK